MKVGLEGVKIGIKGYKCYSERKEIELGKVTILMGPMGGGKSSLLEALALWGRVMSGEVENEDDMFGGSLVHLNGMHLKDLINKETDRMEISVLSPRENGIKVMYIPPKEWGISLFIRGNERALTKDKKLVNIGILSGIVSALIESVEGRTLIEKERDFENIKEHIDMNSLAELERSSDLREDLNKILNLRFISYVSSHRPSPKELVPPEKGGAISLDLRSYLEEREWSSDGSSLIQALISLIIYRIRKKEIIENLEKILNDLNICDGSPCIELGLTDSIPTIKVKTKKGELDVRNLSCGERNCLLTILAAIQAKKGGILIMEEPEIGINIRALSKLFRELCSLDLHLLMSTHSLVPFSAIRNYIISEKLEDRKAAFSNISLYYVNYPNLIKLELDERGIPSLLPEKLPPEQLQEEVGILRSAFFLEEG
jgi:predicted ATP-dependent endonuclease of OLD family